MPITEPGLEDGSESQQQDSTRGGIQFRREYFTNLPNWALDSYYWQSEGRSASIHALRIYIWCIDKVTSVFDDDKLHVPVGRVLGGAKISFKTIGNDKNLNISWGTVQHNMKHLEAAGLIRRFRGSNMQEFSYEVINCKREFKETELSAKLAKLKRARRRTPDDPPLPEIPEMNFLDETKSASFNIEGDEDELA